jgi:hypothetical protein
MICGLGVEDQQNGPPLSADLTACNLFVCGGVNRKSENQNKVNRKSENQNKVNRKSADQNKVNRKSENQNKVNRKSADQNSQ